VNGAKFRSIATEIDWPFHIPQLTGSCRQYRRLVQRCLKGSRARKDEVPSVAKTVSSKRASLVADGALVLVDGFYVFQRDVLFKSPSGAGSTVCGAGLNGWVFWKTKDGKTLDEVKRPKLAS
jgi:hypothetical protein